MKAPLAWGFSLERTQNYLDRASVAKLYEDPQWLRLGHYHSRVLGGYRSKIQGRFFLSPHGATDPQAELVKTIETLFSAASSPNTSHPQCQYMARTKWLREKLAVDKQDIVTCAERDAWKQKLNAKEAYFVFASSDLNSAASSFGHTFIRLHNPDNVGNLDLIDYGVNFAAQTRDDDGALFALRGLFGSYPGTYSMMPYHQKLRDYINLEGRDIWEYKMDLSSPQVEMLIDHLIELEGSFVPYYFLDENCSYALLELIEAVRPDLNLTSHFTDATIPLDTLKLLNQQRGLLSAERRRPSLRSDFDNSYLELSSAQKTKLRELVRHITKEAVATPVEESDVQVLEAALSFLAIKEYRDSYDYKTWKYQLSLARARLGLSDKTPIAASASPRESADSSAWYFGFGTLDHRPLSQLKFRRAFHDLISRDEGVGPFSHVEVLSATFEYEYEPRRLDLQGLQLLKIISTNPVTRLETPISWKASLGTEPKLSPFFEGGAGYSFDFALGQRSRWINLLLGRAFESEGHARIGAGIESLFVQKLNDRLRMLEGVKLLAVYERHPFFEAAAAVSYDLTRKLESRLTYERKFDRDLVMLSLVF